MGIASFVGTLWLNALKMTVIPLVVALLVVGIAKSAEAAQAGRIAGRSVLWIVLICTASSIFGAIAAVALTRVFPLALIRLDCFKERLAKSSRPRRGRFRAQ